MSGDATYRTLPPLSPVKDGSKAMVRKPLSAIVWEDNKIQTSHTFGEGEFSIDAEDDILFLTVNKVLYLKKIKFGKKFVLFEELTCGKKVVKSGLEDGITINVK